MKREIKFRGKSIIGDKWVYGDLLHIGGGYIINHGSQKDYDISHDNKFAIQFYHEEVSVVFPDTVGQFTGKTDINGKDIYNDDVVRVFTVERSFNVVVKWSNYSMAFMACYVNGSQSPFSWFTNLLVYELEVIGNVFDSPELLKGGK